MDAQWCPAIAMADQKYQKHKNKTNNLNGNTNDSSKHNNSDKAKTLLKTATKMRVMRIIIITIKMM